MLAYNIKKYSKIIIIDAAILLFTGAIALVQIECGYINSDVFSLIEKYGFTLLLSACAICCLALINDYEDRFGYVRADACLIIMLMVSLTVQMLKANSVDIPEWLILLAAGGLIPIILQFVFKSMLWSSRPTRARDLVCCVLIAISMLLIIFQLKDEEYIYLAAAAIMFIVSLLAAVNKYFTPYKKHKAVSAVKIILKVLLVVLCGITAVYVFVNHGVIYFISNFPYLYGVDFLSTLPLKLAICLVHILLVITAVIIFIKGRQNLLYKRHYVLFSTTLAGLVIFAILSCFNSILFNDYFKFVIPEISLAVITGGSAYSDLYIDYNIDVDGDKLADIIGRRDEYTVVRNKVESTPFCSKDDEVEDEVTYVTIIGLKGKVVCNLAEWVKLDDDRRYAIFDVSMFENEQEDMEDQWLMRLEDAEAGTWSVIEEEKIILRAKEQLIAL